MTKEHSPAVIAAAKALAEKHGWGQHSTRAVTTLLCEALLMQPDPAWSAPTDPNLLLAREAADMLDTDRTKKHWWIAYDAALRALKLKDSTNG